MRSNYSSWPTHWRRIAFAVIGRIVCVFLFSFSGLAQPGGCYVDTWRYEYCRDERNLLITRYTSEISAITKQIKRDGGNADLYFRRGSIYSAIMFSVGLGFHNVEFDGKVYIAAIDKKAIADFTRAIELAPRADFHLNRGRIFKESWENDIHHFPDSRYLENSSDMEVLAAVEKLFVENENFRSAELDFLQALKLGAGSDAAADGRSLLASLHQTRAFKLTHYEPVAKPIKTSSKLTQMIFSDFDGYIENYKHQSAKYRWGNLGVQNAWIEKAKGARRLGRDDVALIALAEAERLEERGGFANCFIYSNRAEIALKQRNFDFALEDLSYAIDNSPNCKNLTELRGDTNQQKGDLKAAVDDYSKVVDVERPYLSELQFWKRGKIYLRIGEVEKAISDFTAAIGTSTLCEKDYLLRASAYRQAGNEQAARLDEEMANKTLIAQKQFQPSNYCDHHR